MPGFLCTEDNPERMHPFRTCSQWVTIHAIHVVECGRIFTKDHESAKKRRRPERLQTPSSNTDNRASCHIWVNLVGNATCEKYQEFIVCRTIYDLPTWTSSSGGRIQSPSSNLGTGVQNNDLICICSYRYEIQRPWHCWREVHGTRDRSFPSFQINTGLAIMTK